jgi:N-acylneuraminate cytidylyltransferase/CMP-N,N'-diacetyllegionaminic acid synthase
MNRICTVCARAGSKGVKNKNLRNLNGKPLLAHTIELAKKSGLFTTVAISSDSQDILEAARVAGADLQITRPLELATDTAAKLPAIRHAVSEAETRMGCQFDVIVDLDATSPLRSMDDLSGAIRLLEGSEADNVITAAPSRRSPYFNLVELSGSGFVILSKPHSPPLVRRQDAPPCFDMNASIYVWRRQSFFESASVLGDRTRLYVMPEERSLDIDNELDFEIVGYLMSKRP